MYNEIVMAGIVVSLIYAELTGSPRRACGAGLYRAVPVGPAAHAPTRF